MLTTAEKPKTRRTINQAGLDIIKKFEGCVLSSYQDIGGVWTIGYGHTKGVTPNQTITQEEAEEYLKQDLEMTELGVNALIKSTVTDNQFSACVSLAYNIGLGAFGGSTLLKQLNTFTLSPNTRTLAVAERFPDWCKVNGRVIPGLLARRNAEKFLFLKG